MLCACHANPLASNATFVMYSFWQRRQRRSMRLYQLQQPPLHPLPPLHPPHCSHKWGLVNRAMLCRRQQWRSWTLALYGSWKKWKHRCADCLSSNVLLCYAQARCPKQQGCKHHIEQSMTPVQRDICASTTLNRATSLCNVL